MILILHSFYLAGRGKKAELMQVSVYFHRGLLAEALLNYGVYVPELLHSHSYRETLGFASVSHCYNGQGVLCTPWFFTHEFSPTCWFKSCTHCDNLFSDSWAGTVVLCSPTFLEWLWTSVFLPCLQSHYKFHRIGSQIKKYYMARQCERN